MPPIFLDFQCLHGWCNKISENGYEEIEIFRGGGRVAVFWPLLCTSLAIHMGNLRGYVEYKENRKPNAQVRVL